MSIESAYKGILQKIAKLDTANKVRLVAVSKYKPASDIQELYNIGQRHFGENYVQELTEKAAELPRDIQWHFIGALQTNKCKTLAQIPNLYAVETVDSVKKAKKLDDHRDATLPKINIYIQVNTSGEDQKSGVTSLEEIQDLAKYITNECSRLKLEGLMTIGSAVNSRSESEENPDFTKLAEFRSLLASEYGDLRLSMGMSADFEQAIKQGSTSVRVGSSIFGARKTKEEMK